ncbi:HpcH/HpaI aldolase/citrate lyase family protein [Mycobacterium sp. NPDC003449]
MRTTPSAASYLFVPADRPERVLKAAASGADEVIVDLEDGVSEERKGPARSILKRLSPCRPLTVRVNNSAEHTLESDLSLIRNLEWVSGVVLPKAEEPQQIPLIKAMLGARVSVVALIESARGLRMRDDIASASPSNLALGPADLAAELGVEITEHFLAAPRSALAFASAEAGLPGPIDGPSLAISDYDALVGDCVAAKRLGMAAKMCIHPRQLGVVHEFFRPTATEIRWAESVVNAALHHRGAFSMNGQLVDAPVVARAERLIARVRHATTPAATTPART